MSMAGESFLWPDWPPHPGVGALVTTRLGGVSSGPWRGFNLGINTGDDPDDMGENRRRLTSMLDDKPVIQWLRQVHGTELVDAGPGKVDLPRADACYSDQAGRVCAVLTADCMPVLIRSVAGDEVCVAHAGWRGLAGGILGVAVRRFRAPPASLEVWLGPAISQAHYQVGEEVRSAFQRAPAFSGLSVDAAFEPEGTGKWRADLYDLARMQLGTLGVESIWGGGFCTYADPRRFYSYRRDGETGRFATLIWLKQRA